MNLKTRSVLSRGAAALMAATLALTVAGCANGDAGGGAENKTIKMGVVPGYTAYEGAIYLYKNILEKHGYTVEVTDFSDMVPMYEGVAQGDLDVMNGDIEKTQKVYWDEYGDRIEDLGVFYEDAYLFLAVPDYMTDVQSIDDLKTHADEFGNRIVGIEPGAGLTAITQDTVMPEYGLDDWELVTSSTPAMLAEVKKATDAEEPIVVTIWQPFWANSVYPLRPLEDPKEAFGGSEATHALAREGFSEEFPDVAEMIGNTKFDEEQEGTLQDIIVNQFESGQQAEAVQAWLDENPEFGEAMEKYLTD